MKIVLMFIVFNVVIGLVPDELCMKGAKQTLCIAHFKKDLPYCFQQLHPLYDPIKLTIYLYDNNKRFEGMQKQKFWV